MGDMMFAMNLALSIAVVTNTQLAVPDTWGVFSFHMLKNFKARAALGEPKGGYQGVYYDVLGLPQFKKFNRLKWEKQGYKIFTSPFEYFYYRPQKFNDFVPCRSVVMIEPMSCRNFTSYCMLMHGHVVYDTVMPLLRIAWKYSQDTCRTAPLAALGLSEKKVNIVWHMRVGDLCLKCDSVEYYVKVFGFIYEALNGTDFDNIFMFQNIDAFNHTKALLAAIPHSRIYTSTQVEDAVCMLLRTDILVSTGSSFPNSVSIFSPPQRPILFSEVSKEWAMAGPEPHGFWSPWYYTHQTAVKMINGTVQYYKPKYITEIMEFIGLFDRISNLSSRSRVNGTWLGRPVQGRLVSGTMRNHTRGSRLNGTGTMARFMDGNGTRIGRRGGHRNSTGSHHRNSSSVHLRSRVVGDRDQQHRIS
jgi:hypothetical protein